MQRLLFLSSISGLLAAASGCGDDSCGPGDAPDTGLVASASGVQLGYGDLRSRAGNDCPEVDPTTGIVSLTIEGLQTDAFQTMTNLVTFCVPRPDKLADGVQLGSGFRIVDFNGEADDCTFSVAQGSVPTGTARATGICDNGTHEAGFALTIQGNLLLRRECTTMTDMVAVALAGTVAVRSVDP
jgi:hypothetical protein